ncbi:hypothetical protein MK805_08825 [Shimazuella sp. AN120528]|uniref:hypothetical protein n=1 Tax=Shimazuella soli TaxID=1892854 RepID=UPI001F0CFC47|nr:hypothetical protein [Shimazuella soli]MCH5585072.1 hypothetical protein [Shimazuella soli]
MQINLYISNKFVESLYSKRENFKIERNNQSYHNVNIKVKRSPKDYLEQINNGDLSIAKNVISKFGRIRKESITVPILKGLSNLRKITKSNIFAEKIEELMKKDSKVSPFIFSDIGKVGIMNSTEIKEMNERINKLLDKVKDIPRITADQIRDIKKDIQNTPETYFKFARSAEVKRVGFTPNHFSEALEKAGYSKEQLTKLMSLIHLSASCMTDKEWEFVQETRNKIPALQEAVRVFHESEKDRYLGTSNVRNFDGIGGFVADANLYQDMFTKDELIYGVLRLDFDKSNHLDGDYTKKIYAIYFTSPEVSEKSKIPFQRELTLKDNGDISDNAPYNPLTGNGYTSARINMIIPEYQIDYRDTVRFKSSEMLFGHFNEKGEFQPQLAYVDGKWKNIDDIFKANEELQATDRSSEKQQPRDHLEIDAKDIPWDGLER